jgi:hypothetical protein
MRKVYTIRNSDASARTVVVEHPTRPGWKLVGGSAPAETSLAAYRFVVPVAAKSEATLSVEETRPVETRYAISQLTDDQMTVFVREWRSNVQLTQALAPIQAKKSAIASLTTQIAAHTGEMNQIAGDQTRVRGNMGALKGSSDEQQLLKRYVSQLSQQEDRIGALRRETADLEQQRAADQADLARLLEGLSLNIDLGTSESTTEFEGA